MADGLITIGIVPDDSQWTRTMRHLATNSSRTINQAINAHVQPLGKITGEASEFQKSLAASNARVIAFGASTGAIFAVRTAFRHLVQSTIEVEKEMTEINAIFRLGSQQLKRFSNDLFSISSAYSTAFGEAAKAAAEFARQGLTVEETLKRTSAALALSRISGTNMEQSVASLTSIMNTFVKESLTAEEVVNRLVAVDQAYAVSAGDLAEALSRVSSSAADANVSLNQTMALITAAKQITARTGSVIGNSFKTMFTRLQRPQVINDLESVGIRARDAQGKLRPMMDILRALAVQYDELAASQKSFVAETVGGVYQINILKAIMRDLGGGMSIVDGAMQAAGNSTDMVNKRMAILNDTISSQLIRTANSLKQVMAGGGSAMLGGTIKMGLGSLDNFIKDLSFLVDSSVARGGEGPWKQLGANLAQGMLKGVGNALRGPGLQYIVLAMFKLFQRLTAFVYESTKELMNLNQTEKNRQAINEGIARWLGEQKQVLTDILSGQISLNQATEMYLNTMKGAVSAAKDLESVSQSMGEIAITQVNFVPRAGAASGYIPALEVAEARRGGYTAGTVVNTRIHDGHDAFDVTANTAETITRIIHEGKKFDFVNPKEGSPAANAHRAEAIRRTGIDPYAFPQSQVRAGGFIPNLALPPDLVATIGGLGIDIPRDILGTKDSGASRYKMDAFLSLPEGMVTTFVSQYRNNPRALKAILSSMMRKGASNIPLASGPDMVQFLAGAMLNKHAVDNKIYPDVTSAVIEHLAGMFTGKPTIDVGKQEAMIAKTVKLRPQDVQRIFNLHARSMPFIAAYEHGSDPFTPAKDRPDLVTPFDFEVENVTHKFSIPTPMYGFKGASKIMQTFQDWKEMLRQTVGKTTLDFPAGQSGTMRGNYFELALKAMAQQENIGVSAEESDTSPLDIYGAPKSIISQTSIKGGVSGLELKAGALEAMKSGNMAKKIFRTLAGEPGSATAKARMGGPVGYVPKLVNIKQFDAVQGGIGIIDADALGKYGVKGSAFESLVYAAVATGKPLRVHYGPMTMGKTTAAERIVNAVGGLGKTGGDFITSIQDIDSDKYKQFIINKTDVSNLDTGVFGLALSAASQVRTFYSSHGDFLAKQKEMIERLKARNRNDEAKNAEAIARKHDEKLWNQYAANIAGLHGKLGERVSPYNVHTPLAGRGFIPNLGIFAGAALMMKGLGQFAFGVGPEIIKGGLNDEDIMPHIMGFLSQPSKVMRSREDIKTAATLLNTLTRKASIREKFARKMSGRVSDTSFSHRDLMEQIGKNKTESGYLSPSGMLRLYAKYRLFGGKDSLQDYALKTISSQTASKYSIESQMTDLNDSAIQNPDSSITFLPVPTRHGVKQTGEYDHVQNAARFAIKGILAPEQQDPGRGVGLLGKNKYLGYTFLLGRFVGRHNRAQTRATYRDVWDVGLHPEEEVALDKHYTGEANPIYSILDYGGNYGGNIESLILRKMMQQYHFSNPVEFKGAVNLARGFVPNLAWPTFPSFSIGRPGGIEVRRSSMGIANDFFKTNIENEIENLLQITDYKKRQGMLNQLMQMYGPQYGQDLHALIMRRHSSRQEMGMGTVLKGYYGEQYAEQLLQGSGLLQARLAKLPDVTPRGEGNFDFMSKMGGLETLFEVKNTAKIGDYEKFVNKVQTAQANYPRAIRWILGNEETRWAGQGLIPNLALTRRQIYDIIKNSNQYPEHNADKIAKSPHAIRMLEAGWDFVGAGSENMAFKKKGLVFKVPLSQKSLEKNEKKAFVSLHAQKVFEKLGLNLQAMRVRMGKVAKGRGLFQRYAGPTLGQTLDDVSENYREKYSVYNSLLNYISQQSGSYADRRIKVGGQEALLGIDAASEHNFAVGKPETFKKLAKNLLERAPGKINATNKKLMDLLLKAGNIRAIDLGGYAGGFIPNLYQAVADALNRENRVTSGRAMLGSDISLRSMNNPLGLVAYDSRQGSARGAIAEHRAVGQDMGDIRYAHTAARGKIPNLALTGGDIGSDVGGFRDTGGMYSSIGIFNSVILAALMGMRNQTAIPSESADRRRLKDTVLNRLLVSDSERAATKLRLLTREFESMREKLLKGEQAVSSFGETYRGALDIPRLEGDLQGKFASLRSVVKPYEEQKERRQAQIGRAGQITAWGASLGGGLATQFAELSSASLGASVNEFSNGLTQAGQILLTFPNKLGMIGAVTLGIDSMVSAMEVYSRGLHNAQRAFEVSQDKYTKTVAQMDALAASLNQYENMIGDSSVSFDAIQREQRKYAETLAQLSQSAENTRMVMRLTGASDTKQRQAILGEERERAGHRIGLQAGVLGLHEYAAKRSNFVNRLFGVQPFGYSNTIQKQQLEQTMRGTATEAISNMSGPLKAMLMASNSVEEFSAALELAKKSTDENVRESAQLLGDSFSGLAKMVKAPGMRVVQQQMFNQLQIERFDTTPERKEARERLLRENAARQRDIDNAVNRERLAQRMFLNAGSLLGGRELDVKQIGSQMRMQRALAGGALLGETAQSPSVVSRQALAGVMRLSTGERTMRQYEAATESQRIEAERRQKVESIQGEGTRSVLDHLTQNFDSIIGSLEKTQGASAYSAGAGIPSMVEWRQQLTQALGQGLQVISKRGIGSFMTGTGALDTDKLIKAVAQGSGAAPEIQDILTKGLQANIGSVEIEKALLEVNKQIAGTNLDAYAEQQRNNALLQGFMKEMDFKQMGNYLGGIKNLLDRGSRRTMERNLVRGATLMTTGRTPEARAFGAATFLKALQDMQVPLDRSGKTPLSQLINQAFSVGTKNLAVVQQQSIGRVLGAVGRLTGNSLATAGTRELAGRAGLGTAAAAFGLEFPSEDAKVAQEAASAIKETTDLFDVELLQSADALSSFTATVQSLKQNWEKAFLEARITREQKSAEIEKANKKFYGPPEGRPERIFGSPLTQDTAGQKAALMMGRPAQTLATFGAVTLGSMLLGRFGRRGGANQQRELVEALRQTAAVGTTQPAKITGLSRGFSRAERSIIREAQTNAEQAAKMQKTSEFTQAIEKSRAAESAMFEREAILAENAKKLGINADEYRKMAEGKAIRPLAETTPRMTSTLSSTIEPAAKAPTSMEHVPENMKLPPEVQKMPAQTREWFSRQSPSEQKGFLYRMQQVEKATAKRGIKERAREQFSKFKETWRGLSPTTIFSKKPEDFLIKPPVTDIEATKAYEADIAKVRENPYNRPGKRALGRLQERFGRPNVRSGFSPHVKTGLLAAGTMFLAQTMQAGQEMQSPETESPFRMDRMDLASLGGETAGGAMMFGGGVKGLKDVSALKMGGALALTGLVSGRVREGMGGGWGETVGAAIDIGAASKFFGLARGGSGAALGIGSELLRKKFTEKQFGYTAGAGQGIFGAMGAGALTGSVGGPLGTAIGAGIGAGTYAVQESIALSAENKALIAQGKSLDDYIYNEAGETEKGNQLLGIVPKSRLGLTQENLMEKARIFTGNLANRRGTLEGLRESDKTYTGGFGGSIADFFGIVKREFGKSESQELTKITQQEQQMRRAMESGDSERILQTLIAIQDSLSKSVREAAIEPEASKSKGPGPALQSDINVKISVEDYDKIPSELNDTIVNPLAQRLASLQRQVNELLNARSPMPAQVTG